MNITARNAELARATTRDPRWTLVAARDAAADGRFYYSVKTTGVYCRPSCAAPLASPQNIQFHETCEAAEQAGLRPCKRCRPNQPSLGGHYATETAGSARADIRFVVGVCSLGSILVAKSDRGICAILLGDDPDTLTHDLEDRFPSANLIGADAGFEQLVAKVVGFVEAPAWGLEFPLDIRGTAFQQRVWQALLKIPAGSTASYTDIAKLIGSPNSVRAVARACSANALAVAIPCHRVVRNDGALSGYRWGVDRKRTLLEREARA